MKIIFNSSRLNAWCGDKGMYKAFTSDIGDFKFLEDNPILYKYWDGWRIATPVEVRDFLLLYDEGSVKLI